MAGIPWIIRDFDDIDSTSEEAKRVCVARTDALHGLVIRAFQQSLGRGRLGKTWVSPKGNLYQSLIIQPHISLDEGFVFAFISALSIKKALNHLKSTLPVLFKWPNDVLIDHHKVAGVLIDVGPFSKEHIADWYVIGVGINVAEVPYDIHKGRLPLTTSLLEHECVVAREQLSDLFLDSFNFYYMKWQQSGFKPIRDEWFDSCVYTRGQEIECGPPSHRIKGTFHDVSLDGSLVIKDESGAFVNVRTGQVELITNG